MKHISSLLALTVVAVCQFLLTGCANPYADHYAAYAYVSPAERNFAPAIVGLIIICLKQPILVY